MSTLLVVETSPRGDHSISRNLTRRFVGRWQEGHPDGKVVDRDLMRTELPFVNAPWLQAYFTPPERHSAEMKEVLRLSDELVVELLAADHLVIATPVYNYNVPAALKAWIDHVVRKGLTSQSLRVGGSIRGTSAAARPTTICAASWAEAAKSIPPPRPLTHGCERR